MLLPFLYHVYAGSVQDCLDGFTESVQSNYGCLFVGGNVVMATTSWYVIVCVFLCGVCTCVYVCAAARLLVANPVAHNLLRLQYV